MEDVLAYIVYCGSCGECTGYIKCMSVGYDLILNCCSNLYYVIIVYLKPDYYFLFLFGSMPEDWLKGSYPVGPVTGHLDTGSSWFPWVLEQMLGWFPTVPSCHYMLLM